MLTLLQMSLQVFVALTIICLMLPSTLSLNMFDNFKHLDSMKTERTKDDILLQVVKKRETSGADPWSLCPNSMERVDCFLEYLRVYARLRKATSGTSVSVRNIGKRSRDTTSESNLCPDGLSSDLCFLNHLDASMNNFNSNTDGIQGENDADTSR